MTFAGFFFRFGMGIGGDIEPFQIPDDLQQNQTGVTPAKSFVQACLFDSFPHCTDKQARFRRFLDLATGASIQVPYLSLLALNVWILLCQVYVIVRFLTFWSQTRGMPGAPGTRNSRRVCASSEGGHPSWRRALGCSHRGPNPNQDHPLAPYNSKGFEAFNCCFTTNISCMLLGNSRHLGACLFWAPRAVEKHCLYLASSSAASGVLQSTRFWGALRHHFSLGYGSCVCGCW